MYIIVDLLDLRNQEFVCIGTKPKNSDSLRTTAMAEARMTKARW